MELTERMPGATDCSAQSRRAKIRTVLLCPDLTIVAGRGSNFLADFFTRHRNDELVRASRKPILFVNSGAKKVYGKILVATDFSEKSREAARMALLLAPTAQVTFLHAFHVPNEGAMRDAGVPYGVINACRVRAGETARMKLNRFIDGFGPRRQLISRVVHHGFPMPVIYNYAWRMGADMIAVGKQEKPRLKALLHGSMARHFLSRTSCDVLVAGAGR